MKHHNTSNETLDNDSVTSFNPLADILLWIGTLVFANDEDLYDKPSNILEFRRWVTSTSRAVTYVATEMERNVTKVHSSTYVNYYCLHSRVPHAHDTPLAIVALVYSCYDSPLLPWQLSLTVCMFSNCSIPRQLLKEVFMKYSTEFDLYYSLFPDAEKVHKRYLPELDL